MQESNILASLSRDHDEIRSQFKRAVVKPPPIGEAAARLAALCSSHFDLEEKTIYPALRLLHELLTAKHTSPELATRLKNVARFSRQHGYFGKDHEAIVFAVDALLQTAEREGDEETAELGHRLKRHEKIEDELNLAAYALSSLTKTRT